MTNLQNEIDTELTSLDKSLKVVSGKSVGFKNWEPRKGQGASSSSSNTKDSSSEVMGTTTKSSSSDIMQTAAQSGNSKIKKQTLRKSEAMLKKLDRLKVSSKRGRPKKKQEKPKANRYFEIPHRYKLPPVETRGLKGRDLEAMLILETAENLGLSQVEDRDVTLQTIKNRIL